MLILCYNSTQVNTVMIVLMWLCTINRLVTVLASESGEKHAQQTGASYNDPSLLPIPLSARPFQCKIEQDCDMGNRGDVLLHRLIYELGVENKHIPRISLLTCQHGSTNRQQEEQTRTSINIDSLTILRALFAGKVNPRCRDCADGTTDTSSECGCKKYPATRAVLIKLLRIDLLIIDETGKGVDNVNGPRGAEFETLEKFLQSETLRQFVVLDLSCGVGSRKVIEMASNKGLFNSSYHWLLIGDYTFNRHEDDDEVDGDVVDDFKLPQNNVTFDDVTAASAVDETDINSKSTANTIHGKDKAKEDNEPDTNKDSKSADNDANNDDQLNKLLIGKHLKKLNININTELILAKRINHNQDPRKDYYLLYDVWSPGIQYGGTLNITEIGKFSEDSGLEWRKWYRQATTVIRRMDMRNVHLRCMIVIINRNLSHSLEYYLTHHYDTHIDSMHRFNFALLSYVRDMFNFSFVVSRTSSWGYLRNGKFDGMIGALVRRQTDIGGSPIFFRIERAKVIDYTSRTWIARPCFIFRHPRTLPVNKIVFLQPFSFDVWVLLTIFGGITIGFLAILTIIEQTLNEDTVHMERFSNTTTDITALGVLQNSIRPRRRRKRIDIELGSNTQKRNAIAGRRRCGVHGDTGFWRKGKRIFSATTSNTKCMRFSTPVTVGIRSQVPLEYNAGKNLMGSAMDGIDYGAGVTQPVNRAFSRPKGAHPRRIRKALKRYISSRRNNRSIRCCIHSIMDKLQMISQSWTFFIGSICQQGLPLPTNLISGRCAAITILLFSFCIYQFYSASVVGTLLLEKPKTIKTLRNLLSSSLKIGIEDIPYTRDFFLHTRDPDAIELYTKKVLAKGDSANTTSLHHEYKSTMVPVFEDPSASNWYDAKDGVARIKQGGFAFHVEAAAAYKIISDTFTEKQICELSEVTLFPQQKMVSIVQKGSPLRKIITYGLRRSIEAGLMDYQRKVWHSPKPRCVKLIHTDDLRVDMQTFTSAVFVLIFGFATSTVILILEVIHNNLWQYFAT